MPLPLILGILAAGAGALGIGKGVKAGIDSKNAKRVNNSAESLIQDAKTFIESARERSSKGLAVLGEKKISVLNSSVAIFIEYFSKIKHIELEDSVGMEELRKFANDQQSFTELRSLSGYASSIAGGITSGAVGGALTAFGAWGGAMALGTASTGAAISGLTGIAATNATLAFLGGGSLAAGGLGMAGGAAVLGGLIAGPALAVAGFIIGAKAKANLDKAYSNLAEAKKVAEEQLLGFLNAVLSQTSTSIITSIEIIEKKDLPADIVGGKASRLDVRAKTADGRKTNIEVQLENEHNIIERSLYYLAYEFTRGIEKGDDYVKLPPVIAINILGFGYIPLSDFHTSFHLYEDKHKEYKLTDALELHFLDMVKFRQLKAKIDLSNPLHRWLVYFDEQSPINLVQEVIKMDPVIEKAQAKMDMIQRDPALLHAYDMYEMSLIDRAFGIQGARQEAKLEVAKKLKAMGLSSNQISEATGLPLEEIARQ
ncbi:hypothetical protein AGMMS50212_10250 [Spirochaetia bacterium]|nr:hypothetical protein AGMMS50212_10250 [Spirochaetia bacterium]